MGNRGSIVVDEIILPIVDIYLDQGCVVVVGRARGSFPAVQQRDYTVFDEDGRTVYRATGVPGLSWQRVVDGTLTVYAPIAITDRVAKGDGESIALSVRH